ncbi:MAG: hypothetical protein DKINENOH_03859 [bacterium]|nr:hypothetical protein [bacterium]
MRTSRQFQIGLFLAFANITTLLGVGNSHLVSSEIQSLKARGIKVIGSHQSVVSPRTEDSTLVTETVQIEMSLRLDRKWSTAKSQLQEEKRLTINSNDSTILFDNFDNDFPDVLWQVSGNPTWGQTTFRTFNRSTASIWCAAGGNSAISPPSDYPNNMDAMMVFGPFDLSDATYAYLEFRYWLETEDKRDWFFWMASSNGINFSGIGVSGTDLGWNKAFLNFAELPDSTNLIGQQNVWVALSFSSDSTGTAPGVFVEDVLIRKGTFGTGINGFLTGRLPAENSPYIAINDIGVAQNDSLHIEPGVEIRFNWGLEFVIDGFLRAEGTETDSIFFTSSLANPSPGDWVGLGFYTNVSGGTILRHCKVTYAGFGNQLIAGIYSDTPNLYLEKCLILSNEGAGLLCGNDMEVSRNTFQQNGGGISVLLASPVIEENLIEKNGGGISLFASIAAIRNNSIINNTGDGISWDSAKPKIVGNLISNNNIGIRAASRGIGVSGDVLIADNRIIDNRSHGINFVVIASDGTITGNLIKGNLNGFHWEDRSFRDSATMRIYNNTIVENVENGLNFDDGDLSRSAILNNIIAYNGKAGIRNRSGENESIKVEFNNVFENSPNFSIPNQEVLGVLCFTNANGDSTDLFGNLVQPPLFADTSQNDYRLQTNSPCIDAGNPNTFYNDLDGTSNDMGYTGGSRLFVSLTEHDFGERVTSVPKNIELQIYNNRDSTLVFSNIALSDRENFSISPDTVVSISPYERHSITIFFQPQEVGVLHSDLSFQSNNFFGNDTALIQLSGYGIAGTIITSREVSGIWTKANSPYIISTDEIVVQQGDSLKIEPGVDVLFQDDQRNLGLTINGYLVAVGTAQDSIRFAPLDRYRRWEGISFMDSDGSNILQYCIIESTSSPLTSSQRNGIHCENSQLIIMNSTIRNCSSGRWGAVFVKDSAPVIENSTIRNNRSSSYVAGVYCVNSSPVFRNCIIEGNQTFDGTGGMRFENSSVTLRNNIVSNNLGLGTGGILAANGSLVNCYNNLVYGNIGHGIAIRSNSNVILENNTIYGNRIGLLFDNADSSVIRNCILWENAFQGLPEIHNTSSPITVAFSDIKNGYDGEGNIDADPLFVDSSNGDFLLQPGSPTIDAGDPDSSFNDFEDPNNPGFALFPAQGTIRNDMGAYGGPNVSEIEINMPPSVFALINPVDRDTVSTDTLQFVWHASTDPNPDDMVSYTIVYSEDSCLFKPQKIVGISDTSFALINTLTENTRYYWSVIAHDLGRLTTASTDTFSFFVRSIITSVDNFLDEMLPTKFALSQNYPNPFNPQTTIKYQLPKASHVILKIFNILGQKMVTLIDEKKAAGYYSVKWDGTDQLGIQVPSGIYLYQLKAGDFEDVRKLTLVK